MFGRAGVLGEFNGVEQQVLQVVLRLELEALVLEPVGLHRVHELFPGLEIAHFLGLYGLLPLQDVQLREVFLVPLAHVVQDRLDGLLRQRALERLLHRLGGCGVGLDDLHQAGVPAHDPGEGALHELPVVGGHSAAQDHQEPLKTPEGHGRGLLLGARKSDVLGQLQDLIFELAFLCYQSLKGVAGPLFCPWICTPPP